MNIFTGSKFSWNSSRVTLPEGFDAKTSPAFNLTLPVSNNWNSKTKKLLIICEHVDSGDLKAKALCHTYYGTVLSNLLKQAVGYANLTVECGVITDFGLAVVNLQSFKSYNLDLKRQAIAEKHFVRRVESIMSKLEPTHVLVLGDNAARYILKLDHYREKRGWVHEYTRSWGTFVALSTIDPADLITVTSSSNLDAALDDEDGDEDEGGGRDLYSKTNLLGQVYRDMSNIFTYGHVPDEHGLVWSAAESGEKAKHVLLTDILKVERLYERLLESGKFAFDTETNNLNRIANQLLTLQFSLDERTGFVIPYMHRHSPWLKRPKDLARIRDLTYELLCSNKHDPFSTEQYIIGTNLQFDLTQVRQQLKIPIVTKPLFDIQFGDFIFDENIAELDNFKGTTPGAWSLAAITTRHGSNAYLDKSGFNKADRANMAGTDLSDESVINYMGLDTTLPYCIHNLQIARADAVGYTKFKKMVLGQQSNNAHTFSIMEHKGVHIDVPYLVKQMQTDSDMYRILDNSKAQLYDSEFAQEANGRLAEERGVDLSGGLFADCDATDMASKVQIFDVTKPEHRQVIFQDVMELGAVSGFGKLARRCGKPTMTLDKLWQVEHREVYEVMLYTSINKISKLISSYIKSFFLKVTESDDGKVDGRLHPSFGCLYVKTGRGNSFKPSLQQTPSRGKLAKYVKRIFAVPYGKLKLKSDFSANEIRFAAVLAKDKVMAEPFTVARGLRKEMFDDDIELTRIEQELKESVSKRLQARKDVLLDKKITDKERGKLLLDIHIQNIFRFFKKIVAKSDPLRDAIKQIVFGVIYGKSEGTLGKDLWNQKVLELKESIFNMKKQLAEAEILDN